MSLTRGVAQVVTVGSLLIAGDPATTAAQLSTLTGRAPFLAALGNAAEMEDWTAYPSGTVLEDRTFRGVTYGSSSFEALVVGSPHGAGWLLGYARAGGRYASFSFETLSFSFTRPIIAFGVSLSQGNQSQGNRYSGSSAWAINADRGTNVFTAVATYTPDDFTGDAYFGVTDLGGVTRIDIIRTRSDANIVWDIRDIAWSHATVVPEPTTVLLLLAAGPLGGVAWAKQRRAA